MIYDNIAFNITDELIAVSKDGKSGFINRRNEVVIPFEYDEAYPFINGMVYVELYGKSGFINKNGKEIIPIKYNQLWLESEGLIRFVE